MSSSPKSDTDIGSQGPGPHDPQGHIRSDMHSRDFLKSAASSERSVVLFLARATWCLLVGVYLLWLWSGFDQLYTKSTRYALTGLATAATSCVLIALARRWKARGRLLWIGVGMIFVVVAILFPVRSSENFVCVAYQWAFTKVADIETLHPGDIESYQQWHTTREKLTAKFPGLKSRIETA